MPRSGFAMTKSDSENSAPLVRIFSECQAVQPAGRASLMRR